MMRPRVALAAVGTVALVATLAACTKNTGDNGAGNGPVKTFSGSISKDPKDSQGPAAPVPGATRGGTIYGIQEKDFQELDPQRIYINNEQAFGQLFLRTLTAFKQDDKGNLKLVGDLATDTGKDTSSGKCTQWTYTLKDGLKFEDGSPIQAKDVAYGIARSYADFEATGPLYLQQWLSDSQDYNASYKGPYDGAAATPPGLDVKGDKTLVFNFKHPHCDLPYAASMGTTAPVPQAQDTKQNYTNHPISSGPYKVESWTKDSKTVLVRNPYWDPKTDPIRHDYFDRYEMLDGPAAVAQTNQVIASSGTDAYSIMQANVPNELINKVAGDATLKPRTLESLTQFVWVLSINTQRVKDLKVRQALNYAFDKKGFLQALGGPHKGKIANTLQSPSNAGFVDYNAYPTNMKKAKDLLGGKHPELVYAFPNTPKQQTYGTLIKQNLEQAGFKIVLKPIDAASFYEQIGHRDTPYDLYITGWAADWPSGSTVFPVIYSKRSLKPTGNQNYSYFTQPDIEKKIDQLMNEDATTAAPGWSALDKEIMQKYAPAVPMYYPTQYSLVGTKVGGARVGPFGWPDYLNVYAKP